MARHGIRTVTQGEWNVSSNHSSAHPRGYQVATLSVFRVVSESPWKTRKGDANGREFETEEALSAFALAHGYTQRYYSVYALPRRVHAAECRTIHNKAMAAIRKAESKVEIIELCDSYARRVADLFGDRLAFHHYWNGWHMAARRLRRDLWAEYA